MKLAHHFSFYCLLLITSCSSNDDNQSDSEPQPEPIVANARVLSEGECGPDSVMVELFEIPTDSIPDNTPTDRFRFFFWPEEYQLDGLEVFVDYRNPQPEEFRICGGSVLGSSRHRFITREVLLPTDTE